MTPQSLSVLAHYNRWMNQRLYEAAETLPELEITKDRHAFFGSIFHTLTHIAVADTIWLHRFAQHPDSASSLRGILSGFPAPSSLRQQISDSFAGLKVYREAMDSIIMDWAGALTTAQLSSNFTYKNMAGQSASKQFGLVVLHFFNHQTHHRGQVSTLLFQAGVDVGVTDLLAVIPNEL